MTTKTTVLASRPGQLSHQPGRPDRARLAAAFNPPTPAAELAAAIVGWDRIAGPVGDPGPCPVAWCLGRIGCMVDDDEDDLRLHQSAGAIVEAHEFNGISSALPKEARERVLKVTVERCDGGSADEPAIVHVYLGRREGPDLDPGKARELATALRKAQASAQDGTAGALSVVRVRDYNVQIGAVFDGGAFVYINYVRAYTAVELRDQARHGRTCFVQPTETWDLAPVEAGRLANAVEAAAVLADAARAVTR